MNLSVMTRPWATVLVAVVLSVTAPQRLMAGGQGVEPVPQTIEVSALGPQVGEQIPDFNLPDQTGRIRDLQSVMGPRGAMVVFIRSADW